LFNKIDKVDVVEIFFKYYVKNEKRKKCLNMIFVNVRIKYKLFEIQSFPTGFESKSSNEFSDNLKYKGIYRGIHNLKYIGIYRGIHKR